MVPGLGVTAMASEKDALMARAIREAVVKSGYNKLKEKDPSEIKLVFISFSIIAPLVTRPTVGKFF